MPPPGSGLHENRFARTRSLLRSSSLQPQAILKRQRSWSEKLRSQPQAGSHRPSQSCDPPAESSASKHQMRGKLSTKRRATKQSGTFLHAVPGSAACVTDPLSLERDMATLPNQEILENIGSPSRICTADGQTPSRKESQNLRPQHSNAVLSSIPAGVEASFPELKGTIGTYRDGRIQWDQKSRTSVSTCRSSTSAKGRRPRIQLVIPNQKRNRPLPNSPFFGPGAPSPNLHPHIVSASAEFCVSSPPVPKQGAVPDSAVSPLVLQQPRSTAQFQLSIGSQMAKAVPAIVGPVESRTPPLCSSSDDSHEDDRSSIYSRASSVTSAEDEVNSPRLLRKRLNFHERSASATFSVIAPSKAGVFSDGPSVAQDAGYTRADISDSTYAAPRRYTPHPPLEHDVEFERTCDIGPLRSGTIQRRPTVKRRTSGQHTSRRISMDPTVGVINQAISRSTSKQLAPHEDSPTLSEAENELEQHLVSSADDNPFKWDEIVPSQGTESGPPPSIPRKSSKRPNIRLSRVPGDHIASQMKRQPSKRMGKMLRLDIPGKAKPDTDDFFLSPIPVPPPKALKRSITPGVAENVIYGILTNLGSLDDLFATAVVNKGFYRVFKRHELDLMKDALRKSSPPAWEHREICYPGHDKPEEEQLDQPRRDYTPTSYLQYYIRDMYIIAALKSLIKDKCQSFVRPEISAALISEDPTDFARVDDALWRIWTFCKIFGCGKGREDDVVAQMDWLKGGVLANQTECTFSILTTDAIDMSDTLANAPECFAKGNEGGLSAEQLFDMMELWNCLGVLLQPFEGRTIQAREHGVYDNTDVRGGDIDGEETMLDEWYYYLLTLGLSPILDLAAPCCQKDASAFVLASHNGLMEWMPPVFGGTRRNFLKEAASRIYEEKITTTYADPSHKEFQRQLSKQRIQRHITELRHRRHKSPDTIPEIRMSQDRPMSDWENVMDSLTRRRPSSAPGNNVVSHIPGIRSDVPRSPLAQQVMPEEVHPALRNRMNPPAIRPNSRVVAQPLLPSPPPSTVPSVAGDRRSSIAMPVDVHPALRNRMNAPAIRPNSRIFAQPLLPSPPPSTVPSVAGDRRSSIAPSMPSIDEHPAFRSHDPVPDVPSLADHPMFASHTRNGSGGSNRPISSRSAESDPVYQQHEVQHNILNSDPAENSAEKAVYRIVEMGFTAHQARIALRMTDLGDGLRVDRAVELLLREHALL
ncbi:hypothetical protein K491DRAFT_692554 [Lophiostoma macrostomum CBS 122681]|uniref:UBA domain-containing protein n=1 Tax=Lophiostoma macrostomum CBS 122681 TaxID=1314788 RepID=A0A6A6T7L2_9PLEO|nr:hypothetical protein K491DRAFT_692554 [Lophiostoma macrostomum CBS 122681]